MQIGIIVTKVRNQNIFLDPIAVPVHGQLERTIGEDHQDITDPSFRKKSISDLRVIKAFNNRLAFRIKSSFGRSISSGLIIPSPILCCIVRRSLGTTVQHTRVPTSNHSQGKHEKKGAKGPCHHYRNGRAGKISPCSQQRNSNDQWILRVGQGSEKYDHNPTANMLPHLSYD